MRIANVRVVCQAAFLVLFFAALYLAAAPRIAGYPVSVFLEADPLTAVTTALSTGHLYHEGPSGLWIAVGVLILTILLGRAFCGFVCPFGTLHHLTHRLGFSRKAKARRDGNAYRPLWRLKYWILAVFLAGAALGLLQIGLLDPIAFLTRAVTDAVFPAVDSGLRALGLPGIHPSATPWFPGAWFIGLLLVLFLGLNLWKPRFFCRALCPLGALLGLFSRFALFRIHRDEATCNGCDLCATGCEGAAEPEKRVRLSECMVCMNCYEDCPEGAIRFRFLPPQAGEIAGPEVGARRAVLTAAGGFALMAFLDRSGGSLAASGGPGVIRPPGSLPEEEFLARCLKCDACLNVCPTNVLKPATLAGGFEGLWTPVLDFRSAYCEVTCTLCGQVCPTGAIERLTPAERQGLAPRRDGRTEVTRVGTASYDRGRCLPWAMDTPCVVCEEVCPVSPKAIFTREEQVAARDGTVRRLGRPYVDPARCVGCGICEKECPIRGPAAIRVGSLITAI
ncbi:MAG: 4Fe-4S dicluster domain-containing protein [Planctomycetes bacterium]|nr:4Fe-4S dicluster domain-containing protein [Planctomycetota bacterium]